MPRRTRSNISSEDFDALIKRMSTEFAKRLITVDFVRNEALTTSRNGSEVKTVTCRLPSGKQTYEYNVCFHFADGLLVDVSTPPLKYTGLRSVRTDSILPHGYNRNLRPLERWPEIEVIGRIIESIMDKFHSQRRPLTPRKDRLTSSFHPSHRAA